MGNSLRNSCTAAPSMTHTCLVSSLAFQPPQNITTMCLGNTSALRSLTRVTSQHCACDSAPGPSSIGATCSLMFHYVCSIQYLLRSDMRNATLRPLTHQPDTQQIEEAWCNADHSNEQLPYILEITDMQYAKYQRPGSPLPTRQIKLGKGDDLNKQIRDTAVSKNFKSESFRVLQRSIHDEHYIRLRICTKKRSIPSSQGRPTTKPPV
jgi:hypothetical protein